MKTLFALLAFWLLFPYLTLAHSGRTDSSGGHNCNVGSCAGTYHYHNGVYTAPVYTPAPTVAPVYTTTEPTLTPTPTIKSTVQPTATPTQTVTPSPTPKPIVEPSPTPEVLAIQTAEPSLSPIVSEATPIITRAVEEEDSSEDWLIGAFMLSSTGALSGLGYFGYKVVRGRNKKIID